MSTSVHEYINISSVEHCKQVEHASIRHRADLLQHSVADCLPSHGGTDKHKPMADQGSLIQLNAFGHKAVDRLQTHLSARLLDGL